MKRISRTLLIVMVLTMLMSVSMVFANDVDMGWRNASEVTDEQMLEYYNAAGPATQKKIDAVFEGFESRDHGDTTVAIGDRTYIIKSDDLNSIKSSVYTVYSKEKLKNKVSGMNADFNTEADTKAAGVMLSGLKDIVQLVVGILAYLVVIGMGLFTAMDICYITIPVFREKSDNVARTAPSGFTKESSDGSGKRIRFVTDDAYFAVKTCTIDSGKNPLTVYLKKRILAYVMVALVLYILLTGNINLITDLAITVVSGIIDVLSGLGQ